MQLDMFKTAQNTARILRQNASLTLLHSIDCNCERYSGRTRKLFDMNFEPMTTVLKLEKANG